MTSSTPTKPQPARRASQASLRAVWLVLRSAAAMAVLFGLYYYPHPAGSLGARAIDAVLALSGRCTAALLSVFDADVHFVAGTIVGRFPLHVVKACGAFDAHALFAGAVLAYAASLRHKLLALVLGSALLFVANAARMAALYLIGVHAPGLFDAVHEEVFPLLLVLVALGSFALFTRYAHTGRAPLGHAAA